MVASLHEEEQVIGQINATNKKKKREKNRKDTSESMKILCKKFEWLLLLISKDRPNNNIQDINFHKFKDPGHIVSQFQLSANTANVCGYYGIRRQMGWDDIVSRSKKQDRKQSLRSRRFEEETLTKEERKWKSIIFIQEGVPQLEQQEILMK